MSRHIYRACFARFSVVKRTALGYRYPKGCNECGNRDKRGKVHEFLVEHDGGRTETINGVFCSSACCRTYHGLNDRWGEL